ncbi:MAG: TlpA family protein disulfide reductase [Acidobacteria bacterium]|nr:TlpA family protein disulfide reductase [Acidobacteriota bacterium]
MRPLRVPSLAAALVATVALPALAQTAPPTPPPPADRVAALEAQVQQQAAAIEQLRQQIAVLERKVAETARPAVPTADPALEEKASLALSQINQLLAAGDVAGAKAKLAEGQAQFAATQAWKSTGRLSQELAVVGRDAPATLKIDKWYQGEKLVDPAKAKATLVVFWESWCPHCQREVPKLEAIWQKYKDKGLQVVGLTKLTKGTTEEQALAFIKEKGVTYPTAKETGELSAAFNVTGIPAAAILKDGKVVWRGNPSRIDDAMIAKYL